MTAAALSEPPMTNPSTPPRPLLRTIPSPSRSMALGGIGTRPFATLLDSVKVRARGAVSLCLKDPADRFSHKMA